MQRLTSRDDILIETSRRAQAAQQGPTMNILPSKLSKSTVSTRLFQIALQPIAKTPFLLRRKLTLANSTSQRRACYLTMPNHHRRRHDVYDDTRYNQETFQPEYEVPVRHYSERESERHHSDRRNERSYRRRSNRHEHHVQPYNSHDHHGSSMMPFFGEMDSLFDRQFGAGPMMGGFGSMMTNFDRMFDEMARGMNAGSGGNGTYFYESRSTTIGPDGRVHEEHVTTRPDAHGNPETRRTVRDGDRVTESAPFHGMPGHYRGIEGGHHRHDVEEDPVIIEELDDDDGNHPTSTPRRNEQNSRENRTQGGWFQNKYHEWRNRA